MCKFKFAFEEIGKGIISLANLLLILIFLKEYLYENDKSLVAIGLYLWLGLYFFSFTIFSMIKECNNE